MTNSNKTAFQKISYKLTQKKQQLKTTKEWAKFDYNFNVFYLMQLVARSYFKNYGAIFTDYILPIIIMSILFNVLDENYVRTMLPGIIIAPLMSSGFISFAMGFFQWKNSIIFKKIKISQISTFQFFLSFFIFYFFASFFSFAFTLSFAVILKLAELESLKYFFDDLKSTNWGAAIPAVFLMIAIAISLGIIVAFLVTNFNAIIAFGLTIFLVSAFLLGCYLSLSMVVNNEYMYKVSWIVPFYSPVRIFQIAWLEDAEYQINTSYKVPVLKDENKQIIFLEELNLDLDLSNESIKAKIENWFYGGKLEPHLETKIGLINNNLISGEWKMDYINSWNLKIMKNFKILNFDSNFFESPSLIEYRSVHFDKSYWSMFVLGFGWIVTFGGIVGLLNFFKKE